MTEYQFKCASGPSGYPPHAPRFRYWREVRDTSSPNPFHHCFHRSGPVGFGYSERGAHEDWGARMARAGLTHGEPTPAPAPYPERTADADRRKRFFIVRNGDCFQPCHDEKFCGTPIAPYAEKATAIESAVKDGTESRQVRCVYEVRLVGIVEPRDAVFKPVAAKVARKAKRGKKS